MIKSKNSKINQKNIIYYNIISLMNNIKFNIQKFNNNNKFKNKI